MDKQTDTSTVTPRVKVFPARHSFANPNADGKSIAVPARHRQFQ